MMTGNTKKLNQNYRSLGPEDKGKHQTQRKLGPSGRKADALEAEVAGPTTKKSGPHVVKRGTKLKKRCHSKMNAWWGLLARRHVSY